VTGSVAETSLTEDIRYFSFECLQSIQTQRLTPWSRILTEWPTAVQLIIKFTVLYGTRGFVTVFTRDRHATGAYLER